MGTRSEVGFCFAPGIDVPRFEDVEPDWVFDKIIRDERGTFYYVNEIKWYNLEKGSTPNVVETFCNTLNGEDYRMIVMTEGSVEIDGYRWDNEFDLGYISKLTFDDSDAPPPSTGVH